MSPLEASDKIVYWNIRQCKIFKYTDHCFVNEYVEIERLDDSTFKCLQSSTIDLGVMNKDQMLVLFIKNNLMMLTYDQNGKTPRVLKTGSCSCGAWITVNPEHHSDWCDKHKTINIGSIYG